MATLKFLTSPRACASSSALFPKARTESLTAFSP